MYYGVIFSDKATVFDFFLLLFLPPGIKMKIQTWMLMWKMKQNPRERRKRGRKNMVIAR